MLEGKESRPAPSSTVSVEPVTGLHLLDHDQDLVEKCERLTRSLETFPETRTGYKRD